MNNDSEGCCGCIVAVVAIGIGCWYFGDWPLELINRGRAFHARSSGRYEDAVKIKPDDAVSYRLKAQDHLHHEEISQAIETYDALIELEVSEADDWRKRAVAHAINQDLNKASRDLDEVAQKLPDSSAFHLDRAIVETAAGNSEKALKAIQRCLELDAANPLAKFVYGYLLWQKYDDERARTQFSQVLSHDSKASIVYSFLGDCRFALNRFESAQQAYAIVVADRDAIEGVRLLLSQNAPKRTQATLVDITPKLPTTPREMPLWPSSRTPLQNGIIRFLDIVRAPYLFHVCERAQWFQIWSLMEDGKHADAFKAYDKLSDSKRRFLAASIVEANVWLEKNQASKAKKCLLEAIAKSTPQDASKNDQGSNKSGDSDQEWQQVAYERKFDSSNLSMAYFHLARSQIALGEFQDALSSLDRGVEEAETQTENQNRIDALRAEIHHGQKQHDLAIAVCEKMLERSESSNAYYWKGKALVGLGEYEKAAKTFQAAIQVDRKRFDVHLELAKCSERAKDFGQAAEHYAVYLRHDPFAPDVLRGAAKALFRARRYREAAIRYSAAIRHSRKKDLQNDFQKDAQMMAEFSLIRSSAPSESVRHGQQALNLALQAAAYQEYAKGESLAALAAAHAELGDFEKAVLWQERAIATGLGQNQAQEAQRRLGLYQSKQPFRLPGEPSLEQSSTTQGKQE